MVMGDEQYEQHVQTDWAEEVTPAFQPSAGLRNWLLAGCFASFTTAVLAVAAYATMDPQAKGFTVATGLDLVAVVPFAIVLGSYLVLARELGSVGLRRSSLGIYGALILGSLLTLANTDFVEHGFAVGLSIAVLILAALLLLTISYRPAWASASASEGGTAKAGWGGGLSTIGILIFFAIKFLARGFRKVNLGLDEFVGLLSLGLILLCAVFLLVAGIVKTRLWKRLGTTSLLLGVVEALLPFVIIALCVVFFLSIMTVLDNVGPNDEDIDAAIDEQAAAWAPTAQGMLVGIHGVWTIMTVLFFWSVRGSADPETSPEF
jgi:hypothetical protein